MPAIAAGILYGAAGLAAAALPKVRSCCLGRVQHVRLAVLSLDRRRLLRIGHVGCGQQPSVGTEDGQVSPSSFVGREGLQLAIGRRVVERDLLVLITARSKQTPVGT